MRQIKDIALKEKVVFLRSDLNVPIKDAQISNDARLLASIPTIQQLLDSGATVLLCSHLGRPKPGVDTESLSLLPVAEYLQSHFGFSVPLIKNWIDGIEVGDNRLVMLENVRFLPGETDNDLHLAEKMAKLCDVFVMDAFGAAHRAHASTVGITKFAKTVIAGPLIVQETTALDKALANPSHPMLAIVAGAKVSSKLKVIHRLLDLVDVLIVGGGIANTFIAAEGYPVGESLYEPDLIATAKDLLSLAKQKGVDIALPIDVIVGQSLAEDSTATPKLLGDIAGTDKIFDIGPSTRAQYEQLIGEAQTILWNGPVGVFELAPFSAGTEAMAKAIANSSGFSLAGGGDTIAAIEQYEVAKNISYISTGGGAFLEYVEGAVLPGIAALKVVTESIL
jgi:phosphoglycerate kinase